MRTQRDPRRDLGSLTLTSFFMLCVAGQPLPADTVQDFDCNPDTDPVGCTPHALGIHARPVPPRVLAGGPTGNFLRLVSGADVPPVVNTVDFIKSDAGVHCGAVIDFDFRMANGNGPADGLGVALLNTGVYGQGGAVNPKRPFFVSEEPSFIASLGVGFDIYRNFEPGDIDDNHVSVHWDGQVVAQVHSPVELASGEFIHARIVVDSGIGSAELSVILTTPGQSPVTVVNQLPISSFTPYESRLHFGARVGGKTADHDLDNIRATFQTCEIPTGTLIVEKQTLPHGRPDRFVFSGAASGILGDDDWMTVSGLAPGSYAVTESVPSTWALDSISCRDDDSVGDLKTATATYQIEAGETVFCTFTNEAQEATPSCAAASTLSCSSPVVLGNNSTAGSTRAIARYDCVESSYGSAEFIYGFVPPVDGRYQLRLEDLSADLDLIILGPDSCRSDLCLTASDAGDNGSEEVSFDAQAGERFFVVIDGVGDAVSDYALELTCPTSPAAAFTLVPEFPTAGEPVRFFDTSEGEPSSWSWELGDGVMANAENPRHIYGVPDTYTVTLTVENAAGNDIVSREIVVAPPASLSLDGPDTGLVRELSTFTATSQGCQPAADGWQWLTAGGEVEGEAIGATLKVRWGESGTKLLSVRNSACGEAAGSRTVEIISVPVPEPPAAPTDLEAQALSATDIELRWEAPSPTTEAFRIDRSHSGGPFEELALVPGSSTAVGVSVADTPNPTRNPTTFRVFALNNAGSSPSSNEVSVTTEPESCDSARNLCLLDKRFAVEASWRNFTGATGKGQPVLLTSDTGYFWFFSPNNVEVMIKVIDGRSLTGHFWVFYGALSNIEYRLRVIDTETGNTREYFNPANQFASVGDTSALPGETAMGARLPLPAAEAVPGDRLTPWEIYPKAPTNVHFTWVPNFPEVGEVVLFEDRSEVLASRIDRIWDFGDGTMPVPVTNDALVRHVFSQPGSFKVTLSVMEPGDIAAQTVPDTLEVTPALAPRILLDAPESVAAESTVTLAATANEGCKPVRPRGWQWDVDGGAVRDAANRSSIDVVWFSPGRKSVTVSNSGCPDVSASDEVRVTAPPPDPPQSCEPGETTLCLRDNRFRIEVAWEDFEGNTGDGRAQGIGRETGYFWFFNPENIELVVKVLDGRCLTGHFWVFYGALSNVEFELTVTDTKTGSSKTYRNPARQFASVGDVRALPGECPGS